MAAVEIAIAGASDEVLICMPILPTAEDEGASTDVGSYCSGSSSDAGFSSTSSGMLGGRQRPTRLGQLVGAAGLQRRRGSSRKIGGQFGNIGGRRCFGGTPLEPIPGTPVAAGGGSENFASDSLLLDGDVPALPLLCAHRLEPAVLMREATAGPPPGSWSVADVTQAAATGAISLGAAADQWAPQSAINADAAAAASDSDVSEVSAASAPPLLYGRLSMAAPTSPKRRAREATIAKAKRQGVPLKVRPPPGCDVLQERFNTALSQGLNKALPVKKRPVFGEVAGEAPAEALRSLEPGLPVKKVVPGFLLAGGPQFLAPPPGLGMRGFHGGSVLSAR